MKEKLLLLLLLLANWAIAQRTITGKLNDAKDGSPLIGASVVVKGTTVGTATDYEGNYSLTVPANAQTLVFSSIGYATIEEAINGRNLINVALEPDTKVLQDVVVVGYGTQLRKELTGSVSKMSGDVISKLPVTGLDQAMQGQAPGVQVTSASGTPGSSVSVRVRGPSSISAGNQPLYVVDGIPINTGSYAQIGLGGQQTNALADINPNDIESIEVLKDAAAAAIYGSRASNGVVLITTKRGASQKTKVDANVYYGTQQVWKTIQPLGGPDYVRQLNEMIDNRFGAGTTSANNTKNSLGILNKNPDSFANTNWQNEVFRTAPIMNGDLSFSGGNEKTKFFISGSYFNQEGIILGSGFERYSTRINVDNRVSSRFKVGSSTFLSRSTSTRINNDNNIYGVLSTAVLMGSHIPVRNADGTYAKDVNSSTENPVAAALEPTFNLVNHRALTNLYGELEILSGLNFRTSFGVDYLNYREQRFAPTTTNQGAGVKGLGNESYSTDLNLLNENTLTYRTNLIKDLSFDALLGVSFQNSKFQGLFLEANNFPGNTIRTLNAGSVKTNASSNYTEWGLNSYFSRFNFNYKGKYLLSASIRADGSSRFGANNRYGTFPAVSAAWRISEESFMKNLGPVSDLKLRASWGIRGNQDIANFASRGLISGGSNYLQTAGLAPTQLGNANLTWEQREDINLGLDIGLFKDRLSLTIEAYQAKTKNLLLNRPIVFISGFGSAFENIGQMTNRGIDVGITSTNFRGKNFEWTTNFNISFLENKVDSLAGAPFASGFASWVEKGYALGSFRGYRVEGIFQKQEDIDALDAAAAAKYGTGARYQTANTRPGDIRFKDLNKDGRITSDDQEVLGNGLPSFWGGLTNNFRFYGFDLSIFLQYQYGNYIYNNTRAFAEGMNGVFGQFETVKNRWTSTNTNTDIPRAVWQDPNNNRRTSDRWLEDGSYLRVKNVTLGYTVPIPANKYLRSLRVYVTGQNLLTFTKYTGFDPEVSTFGEVNTSIGTDFLTFPQARTILFGLNVGF